MSPFLPFGYSLYQLTGQPHTQEELKFDIYCTYLKSMSDLLSELFPSYEDLYALGLTSSSRYRTDPRVNLNLLSKYLFISWNSEHLATLNNNTDDSEIIRINNQWKPIQTYYALYSISEALLYCSHLTKLNNHKKTLQAVSNYFVSTEIPFWGLSYSGCRGGKNKLSTLQFHNFPKDLIVPSALQRTSVSPIQMIACCIRAEHNNRISEWKKPRKSEIMKYEFDPGYTTIFHFLYRLRIKSNYEDAEVFLAQAPVEDVLSFSSSLSKINFHTSLLLEIFIMRKIGKANFIAQIDKFLAMRIDSQNLKERRKMHLDLYT